MRLAGGWLATSKLQQRSAGHRLVLLQCLDRCPDGRMCIATRLPKAVVPALAFVIGTMLVVQDGLEQIPGYRWKHRWNAL